MRTPLEVEVAALLSGNKNTITENRALTKAEEKALKAMSLEEVGPIKIFILFMYQFETGIV